MPTDIETQRAVAVVGTGTGADSGRPIRRRFAVDGRVRSGCLTCKARKKKCDGQRSDTDMRCRSCVRLGLVCEQRAPRRVVPGIQGIQGLEGVPFQGLPPSPSSPPASGYALATTAKTAAEPEGNKRAMLRYFLDHVAPLCSILQQDAGRVCAVLLPMAIIDASLMHALFTYACTHLDATTLAVAESDAHSRLRYENEVARGVVAAIVDNTVTETTLACALVMSTAEVVSGDTSRWLVHLDGARHIVSHLGNSRLLASTDGEFLLRYFAYHDIMASLSTKRPTSVDKAYWLQEIDGRIEAADPFMGLAHHLFQHLIDLCAFTADTNHLTPSSHPDELAEATKRASQIDQSIRSQDLHLSSDLADDYSQALIHHAEAFRSATLVYLYRRLLPFSSSATSEANMVECVGQIIHHVFHVPETIPCEMGLLFPLFMAGIASTDQSTNQYIQSRLASISTWTRFRHIARVREFLEMLWERENTDAEELLEELRWTLSLA